MTRPGRARTRLFSWAVWHSCRMGARNQEQTRGRIGPQLRLGNLRVGELHFSPLCTALDQAPSLSRKLAYVPGPTFGFVKLLASSGSHCTKWADEQHRQAGFESRLVPDLPLPFIPTLIGLRAFDLVSSRVWWEAATNKWHDLGLNIGLPDHWWTLYPLGQWAGKHQATLLFVDFTKAFDSIHREKMEQILLAYGLPKETVAAIMILYRNTKVKVRSPDGDTEYFIIVAGVL